MENKLIGSYYWTTKNLNLTTFRNGDTIPIANSIQDILEFADLEEPCCCYYDFDENNSDDGLLYNWYAVTDERILAPENFWVANHEHYIDLKDYLYSMNKNEYEYEDCIEYESLFEKSGFNPVGAGWFEFGDGIEAFCDKDTWARFWTSSMFPDSAYAPCFTIISQDDLPFNDSQTFEVSVDETIGQPKGGMLSVRCIKL